MIKGGDFIFALCTEKTRKLGKIGEKIEKKLKNKNKMIISTSETRFTKFMAPGLGWRTEFITFINLKALKQGYFL